MNFKNLLFLLFVFFASVVASASSPGCSCNAHTQHNGYPPTTLKKNF